MEIMITLGEKKSKVIICHSLIGTSLDIVLILEDDHNSKIKKNNNKKEQ